MGLAIPNLCIYCSERPPDSKEHWLPRLFGTFRGVDTLRDRLCIVCNGNLGLLDDELSQTGPVGLARHLLGITGRHDKARPAPPYFRGQTPDLPTVNTFTPEGFDHPILAEDIPGSEPLARKPARHFAIRDKGGAWHYIPITLDKPDGWLRMALEKRGITAIEHIEVHCSEGEDESAERMLRNEKVVAKEVRFFTPDGPSRVSRGETALDITVAYTRGLAKLAFHYALHVGTTFNGAESAFAPLRAFVKGGEGAPATFCQIGPDNHRWFKLPDDRPGHVFELSVADDCVTVAIGLFCGTVYATPVDIVRLAKSASPPFPSCRVAHGLGYYPSGNRAEYDGEVAFTEP